MRSKLIYGLVDPRTSELRYIGRSSSGLTRPKQHTAPAALAKDVARKGNWLRQLVRAGKAAWDNPNRKPRKKPR